MDNSAETHYVSFLGREGGGGMGSNNVSRFRRSRQHKRYPLSLRVKAQLLLASFLLSVVLFSWCFFWLATHKSGDLDAALIPKDADGSFSGDYPSSVYEWEEKHFTLAFNRFMLDHDKAYSSLEEKQRRYKIFKANLTHIQLHNEQGHSYELGMNKFGDWTREEFARMAGFKSNPASLQQSRLGVDNRLLAAPSEPLPASIDWREKGCVTAPKDQGQCGSCWAFSTTGAVEGAWCSKKGKLFSLSEQMLMDCSRYLGNNGCNGGLMDDAFSYVTQKGLCEEKDYPYEAKDAKCRASKCKPSVHIKGFFDIPPGNEAAMRAALATHGPVSVAIQADQVDFQFYKSGVFDAPCGSSLDHGVLLVGYGTDSKTNKDFFIMKNSWGKGWGQEGYMLMAQHKGKEGQCGLLLSGSYPLVEGETPPGPEV
ncbi:hypothetical protein Efla_002956 [Eimeria flavescens]